MYRLFRYSLLALLLAGCSPCYADVVSLSSNYVAGQSQITTKLNDDRTQLTNGVNNVRGVYQGSVQSSGQIQADTIGEANMADDANPRIRTAEGGGCDGVVTSGLTVPTSGSLVGNIQAGVVYPSGYRIEKTSSTAKLFTASKWTFVYVLPSGSFNYQEVAIGGAVPTTPTGAAILARVSTNTSAIGFVTDLRRTSCASGPFNQIVDAPSEATLADLFANGAQMRRFSPAGRTPEGFVTGLWVSMDSNTTQFKVTKGAAYINGKYRVTSQDITVPSTTAIPAQSVSGIDTPSIVSDTTYFVYAAADEPNSKNLSVVYSTSAVNPSGTTNYRLIGRIGTDSGIKFASANTVYTAHAYTDREVIETSANFNGQGNIRMNDSSNISALIDNGTGDYSLTIDSDYNSAKYTCVASCVRTLGTPTLPQIAGCYTRTVGSVSVTCEDENGSATDPESFDMAIIGDFRK